MRYLRPTCALLFCAILVAAEEKPKADKNFKTPQEAYTAFITGLFTFDHELVASACTKPMLAERLIFLLDRAPGFQEYLKSAVDNDGKKPDEKAAKAFAPYLKVLTAQGWSEKTLRDYIAKNKDWDRQGGKMIQTLVKDPEAAYVGVGKLASASMPKRKPADLPDNAKKLDNVKITGDKATGDMKVESARLLFVKTDGGWKITGMEMIRGEPVPFPKEKSGKPKD